MEKKITGFMTSDLFPGMGCNRLSEHLKEKGIELTPPDYPLFDNKNTEPIVAMSSPKGLEFALRGSAMRDSTSE